MTFEPLDPAMLENYSWSLQFYEPIPSPTNLSPFELDFCYKWTPVS